MDTRTHAYHTTLLSRLFWREKGLGDKKKKLMLAEAVGRPWDDLSQVCIFINGTKIEALADNCPI